MSADLPEGTCGPATSSWSTGDLGEAVSTATTTSSCTRQRTTSQDPATDKGFARRFEALCVEAVSRRRAQSSILGEPNRQSSQGITECQAANKGKWPARVDRSLMHLAINKGGTCKKHVLSERLHEPHQLHISQGNFS